MPTRLLTALTVLLLVCFALTLNNAFGRSGTGEGDLWLLTSLILGVGLIAAALGTVASLLHGRHPNQALRRPSDTDSKVSVRAGPPNHTAHPHNSPLGVP